MTDEQAADRKLSQQIDHYTRLLISERLLRLLPPLPNSELASIRQALTDVSQQITQLGETLMASSAENLAKFEAFANSVDKTLTNVQEDIARIKQAVIDGGMNQGDTDKAVALLDAFSAKFAKLDEENPVTP